MTGSGRLLRAIAVPVYPILAAAYPVIFLYAQNLHEAIAPHEVVLPLAVSLGITLGALLVFRALTRSWASAALMSTLLVVLFFTYGMAWDWIGKMLLGHWVLVSAWALVAVTGVSMIWRFEGLARRVAMPLNVIAALLVGFNLMLIAAFSLGVRPGVVVTGPGLTMSPAPSPGQELPDVYWIILDRYGSGNVLDKYYDYDNSPFLDELRARGFYVAEHATANYLVTALSMDSSRNMDYLDFASLRERATADHDWGPVYADLSAPFQVEHYLRSAGYRFLYLGSTWGPTARHPSAEINYVYDQLASEFLGVLEQSTILRAFEGLGAEAPFDRGWNRWNQIRYEWAGLNRASTLRGPKFVHAHFVLPHDPYIFHADGSFVTAEEENARTRSVNYADQVQFANSQVLDWLNSLLAVPASERPIVIIQADEGPRPARSIAEGGLDWTKATRAELEEKFGILSTFYLPGKTPEEAGLYDSITPVNQFRAIFHAYFGLDLPLLPDRNWVFVDKMHIYTQVDVTEKVPR
jgi:hypothetical protein